MLFFSRKEEEIPIDEVLSILNGRLSSAVYLDDKLESLEEIYVLSLSDPISVGIYSLNDILSSLEIQRPIQYKILNNIFQSANGSEFIDICYKQDKNIENILNNYIKDINYLLTLHHLSNNINKLSNIALRSQRFTSNLKFLSKINIVILFMLTDNIFFKEQIVVEGILEAVLERINTLLDRKKEYDRITKLDSKLRANVNVKKEKIKINNKYIEKMLNNTNLYNLLLLLIRLISNSIKNHKYFLELNYKRIIDKVLEYDINIFFELLSVILNHKSGDIKNLQEYLIKDSYVELGFKNKKYNFIYLLIKDNIKNIKKIEKYIIDDNLESLSTNINEQKYKIKDIIYNFYLEENNFKEKNSLLEIQRLFFIYKDIPPIEDYSLLNSILLYKEIDKEINIKENQLKYNFNYYIFLLLRVEKLELDESDILYFRSIIENESLEIVERGLLYLILLEKDIKYKDILLLNKLREIIAVINIESEIYIVDEIKEIIIELIGEKIRTFLERDIDKEVEEYKSYKEKKIAVEKKEDRIKSFISNITAKFQGSESDAFDL